MQQPPVTIVAVGDFGRAVAGRLVSRIAGTHVTESAPAAATTPLLPIVLASWREARTVARAIDANDAVPWWLPVILAHPQIRVGPVFGPHVSGCYDCLLGRVLAADPQPHLTRALWDLYDRDATAGPLGYLEHHASVAAALATMLIRHDDSSRRRVLRYNVLGGTLRVDEFVPVDGCSRWKHPGAAETISGAIGSAGVPE
ncbi:TOMM precursor leader peptide-binding protein [Micromonospora sp. WMMD1082]|uniref:TOMM precursor leader peptide-binding protein n=1 Tax=Micromonospora sp. WMMD1082 TaxID=3016104 RepID=UPI0024174410|nr:TOMM precursor leader peptide-binding protein [Micromonospora sp. WMMD1082]MDG4797052.1 TOMM precursor leader peptide-binding protein [Micromonospora sp. WMMD1082]